jgi:type IV pilus assembly protein PilX
MNYTQTYRYQQGLVLFVALVALVVMSLAAVALIRSVDTNNLVTGNLAYKQSAAITSSYGMEAMADTVGANVLAYAESDHPTDGYYSNCEFVEGVAANRTCKDDHLYLEATWTDANSKLADSLQAGITAGKDQYGNTVRYIVERMCRTDGPADSTKCLMSLEDDGSNNGCSNNVGTSTAGLILPCNSVPIPLYRVTVRISGPKNTVSFVQAFFS